MVFKGLLAPLVLSSDKIFLTTSSSGKHKYILLLLSSLFVKNLNGEVFLFVLCHPLLIASLCKVLTVYILVMCMYVCTMYVLLMYILIMHVLGVHIFFVGGLVVYILVLCILLLCAF